MQIYTNFESNSQLFEVIQLNLCVVSDANLHKFWKQFTTPTNPNKQTTCCFRCKSTQILKAIHNCWRTWYWLCRLFPMQIYTNFESNSQQTSGTVIIDTVVSDANLHKFWKQFTTWQPHRHHRGSCFRCKSTQILKAIHNSKINNMTPLVVVSDANLHKFWKQFTTHESRITWETCCFRCKSTQILKAIHNTESNIKVVLTVVSDANLHKFWKQFTTPCLRCGRYQRLFPMQIYTNFESNSQHIQVYKEYRKVVSDANLHKFWKQFTTRTILTQHDKQLFPMQIYTNFESNSQRFHRLSLFCLVVSDANLHKFWKQFTTSSRLRITTRRLFPMQSYTNFESNSQLAVRFMDHIHVVSDANLHKFWKQFTTILQLAFSVNCCFRCKSTQILKAIHNIIK